jgi:hypothetical protein
MMYTHVTMMHPQNGASTDQYGCAIAWMPVLFVEGSRQTRGVQAAVESMRNEVVQRQDQLNNAVALGQREAAKRIGDEQCQTERLPKAT